jgi:polyisoprenoid-binding protein YceI
MKIPLLIQKMALPFLFLFLIVSCADSSGKKSDSKKDEPVAETKKDTAAKKDTPASTGKGSGKKWNADPATAQVKFSVKGLFGTVHGSLSGLKSTVLFDEDDLGGSSIRASVDPKTIATGVKMRNNHLQKEEYFNSDKYPAISFQSDKFQKIGTGYKVIGNLTIKGVTKHVEIPFNFAPKGNGGVFKGSFAIERLDYGIGGSGGSIGKTITIDLEVPVTK